MKVTTKMPAAALTLARSKGLVRKRELAEVGGTGATLHKLLQSGELIRVSRGLYAAAESDVSEHYLAHVAIKYPTAVFCLLTALQIHGLTTQTPHEVWVAIPSKARAPSPSYPPLCIVRLSEPDLMTISFETKVADGVVRVLVTTAAKTIADCFKFRNKIGLDIALEALRDAWQQRKVTMDELWEAAQQCRMEKVMRPYLESLV